MKSFLVIGLGRFGRHICNHLTKLGHEVMAVDRDEKCVNDSMDYVSSARIGDGTDREFLQSLGVRNFDCCIVTISGGTVTVSGANQAVGGTVKNAIAGTANFRKSTSASEK